MERYSVSYIAVLLLFFNLLHQTTLTTHDGLISNARDRYFVDDLQLHEELSSFSTSMEEIEPKLLLKFEPEFLDFQQRPLGVPHLEKVTLFNVDRNRSIDMTSISGSTVHFHSSFFEDKKIPPLGNTSFNVVFLGREEGAIESNLFIHTTEGHFKYQVKGASVSSPYRLRPIVGIKLPPNSTFSPLIHMHNPHPDPIQILEIYSSGGDFHLELPSGELEGPKNMWEIPSMHTKAIIRVKFNARTEQNHTAYVRIKLNNTEDILVVPLEVEVTSSASLFTPQGSIDFGIGGFRDPPKHIDLILQNPLKKSTRITSVTTDAKSVSINFESIKIPADGKDGTLYKIGTATLDWKKAFEHKEYSGKIYVQYNTGKEIEIPFFSTVIDGGLVYNSSVTTYFINKPNQLVVRDVTFNNTFISPLLILNISLPGEAEEYFKIYNFQPGILQPGELTRLFTIEFQNKQSLDLKVNTYINLQTNLSIIQIPLLSYNGKFFVHFPYKSKDNALDLGLVSFNIQKYTYFVVLNSNPIPISINQLTTSLPGSNVDIVYCGMGNYSLALLQDFTKNSSTCITLNPNEFTILGLSIKSPQAEGQVWGDVVVETDYERLSIPVHYKVASGKLEIGPDRLVFDKCFPGKICSHPIKVHSTFNDPMVIESIVSIPPDPRLKSKHLGHIMARSTKIVGYLYLDPSVTCEGHCYTGLTEDKIFQWLNSLTLPQKVADTDLNLVNTLYMRYLNATSNGLKKWENLTIRLDTSEIKGHIFKTRVKMSWPTLISMDANSNNSLIHFPLGQLGNVSYQNITIRNPCSRNLLLQLVLHDDYPDYEVLNDGLPPAFLSGYKQTGVQRNRFSFAAKELHSEIRDIPSHANTIAILLFPGELYNVTIKYKVEEVAPSIGYLYIRNNLTAIEVVQLKAQGAVPVFKFGNRKPGSIQPLAFELVEKHLRDCERQKRFPNLTVKRTFTARNLGDVTIFINGFYINDLPCEGYGFRVLNCEPFLLEPNSTRKIDIAFTPDFTLAKVTRNLIMDSSLNYLVNYSLLATLPSSLLLTCSNALIRPFWEGHLYYVSLCLMVILLVFVVAMVVVEAEHILKEAASAISRSTNPIPVPLDLRLIGAQARNEMRDEKVEEKSEETVVPPPPPPPPPEPTLNTQGTNTEEEKKEEVKEEPPPEVKPKEEEKYTVLIPATGKSKKRFGKKNGELIDEPKKRYEHKGKCKYVEKPHHETTKKLTNHEIREMKKLQIHLRRQQKAHAQEAPPRPVTEEESSSTTTDGSNEENDKENKNKTKKNANTKNELHVIEIRSNQPVNANFNDTFRKFDKRGLRKLPHKKDRDVFERTPTKFIDLKPKLIKNNNLPKEKVVVASKLSDKPKYEKNATAGGGWNEKTKFSDVVTKIETPPTTPATSPVPIPTTSPPIPKPLPVSPPSPKIRPLIKPVQVNNTKQTQTTKPTMYVEPYKQMNIDLGPIGSRKTSEHQENHYDGQTQYFNNTSNNSFFSDGLPMENSNLINLSDSWERDQTVDVLPAPRDDLCPILPTEDSWTFQTPNTNCTGVWDPTPATNNVPQNGVNNQDSSSYLWGSSLVWQPWQPAEYTRNQARTPPGFQNNQDTENPTQNNPPYDPFGLNIWSQQQNKPWTYPPGQ